MFMDTEKQPGNLLNNDQEPSAEYWQARVERLQETVCFLLAKNQAMRMALAAEKATNRDMCSRGAVARADRQDGVDSIAQDSLN
jgi:hypothetical protein